MIEYRRRRPPLYRLARYLRWSAVLAVVLVVLFLLSTIYSAVEFASHVRVTTPHGGGYAFNYTAAGGFTASFEVNLTNAGYYPLVLDLSTVARTPQGPLVPYATTGAVTIAPGNRTTTFGLTLRIPAATVAADEGRMLLNDTPIAAAVWLNGSYAWIYQFGLSVEANATWGAPFANLSVVPGTPTVAAGTTTVPATISFTNDALFADTGNLTFQVVDDGTDCGAPVTLMLDAASHASFSEGVNLSGPSSCLVPGAAVEATYTLGSLTVPLPTTRVG